MVSKQPASRLHNSQTRGAIRNLSATFFKFKNNTFDASDEAELNDPKAR